MAYDSEGWEEPPTCPKCNKFILTGQPSIEIIFLAQNVKQLWHADCAAFMWRGDLDRIMRMFRGF